jgi:Dolichyl-phosphate-mannose-protein mannosyltransferase
MMQLNNRILHRTQFPYASLDITSSPTTWLCIAVLLYLGLAAFSIDKPLVLDEAMPEAYNAAAIADLGHDALGSTEYHYEISHPTLHQHLIGFIYNVVGKSTVATRLLNVICTVISLLLIAQFSRALFPGAAGAFIGGIAALLYASNPYVVQHSLIVAQDTTLVPIGILLFLWILTRKAELESRTIVYLGIVLAFCAWAKEFSPFFVMLPTFLYLLWRDGFPVAFRTTALVGIIGGALFVVTWTAYCFATGVPLLSFIEFSVRGKALNEEFHAGRSLLGGLYALVTGTGLWVTPGFLILLAVAGGDRILQLARTGFAAKPCDVLWLYTVILWTVTNLYLYANARWQFSIYCLAVILVAEHLYRILRNAGAKPILSALGIGLLVAVVLTVAADDPLLIGKRDVPLAAAAIWYTTFWLALPLLACFLGLMLLGVGVLTYRHVVLTLLSFSVATSGALDVKQTASYATIGMSYGESGFYRTLAYLKAQLGNSVPLLRKDLAFYLMIEKYGRDMSWEYTSLFRGDLADSAKAQAARDAILHPALQYVVLDPQGNPGQAAEFIAPYFEHVATFGDFRVYKKK